jgi:hypothetical protein
MRFIDALNAVHDNIWALFILGGGVTLMLRGHSAEGASLVTLGAGVFRSGSTPAPKQEDKINA